MTWRSTGAGREKGHYLVLDEKALWKLDFTSLLSAEQTRHARGEIPASPMRHQAS
jgi:hypothetical protein